MGARTLKEIIQNDHRKMDKEGDGFYIPEM